VIRISLKAQAWSLDIALGIVIFMGAFFIFYAMVSESQNTKIKALQGQALDVAKQVASQSSSVGVINQNEINESKLDELKNLSYDELKRRLRVEGDVCIYIEDEKGNLVLISNKYKGIGSPNINLSGTPCSQP